MLVVPIVPSACMILPLVLHFFLDPPLPLDRGNAHSFPGSFPVHDGNCSVDKSMFVELWAVAVLPLHSAMIAELGLARAGCDRERTS